MLDKLFDIIQDRKEHPVAGSYTNELFNQGPDRAAQKVGEEAIELIIAAGSQTRQRSIEESADLIYHLFVLWVEIGINLKEVEAELARRHEDRGD